ncbi:MAG TPA: hypothetical protein VFX54_11705 [Candidatus Binatia bacterium]|nr:hypothetical protein [Candidatus Binatia bacterium]
MVPEVNRKAMRRGRAAAARLSADATKASNKINVVETIGLRPHVIMAALYHGATLDRKNSRRCKE